MICLRVVERNSVGLLAEIGVKGIGQIDEPSWGGQRLGDLAVAVKKTGERGERTGGVFETAHVRERLQGVEGEHLFPDRLVACCEAKKVDQDEGIPGDGAMGSMGFDGLFPLQVIHDGFHQPPDVFIGHQVPPEALGA